MNEMKHKNTKQINNKGDANPNSGGARTKIKGSKLKSRGAMPNSGGGRNRTGRPRNNPVVITDSYESVELESDTRVTKDTVIDTIFNNGENGNYED